MKIFLGQEDNKIIAGIVKNENIKIYVLYTFTSPMYMKSSIKFIRLMSTSQRMTAGWGWRDISQCTNMSLKQYSLK